MKQERRFNQPDGVTSSVIFIIENRELYASKEVLALCSPVFRSMFEDDFRERTADVIPLPGKSYKDMVEFLLCIYPDTLKAMSDDTVFPVLNLADEYQVDILLRKCVNYLLSKCTDTNVTLTELVNIMVSAERYNQRELYKATFDSVAKAHPDDLKQVTEFGKLSEETREKFKRSRSQALDVKLTDGNIHDVLGKAVEYNEQELVDKCEQHLIARCKKSEKPLIHGLCTMLGEADKYRLRKLKDEVIELAFKRKSYELEASPIFKTVAPETKYRILSKRVKVFENMFNKLTKLRCHCCRKHSDYNCKICFVAVCKEHYANAGLTL